MSMSGMLWLATVLSLFSVGTGKDESIASHIETKELHRLQFYKDYVYIAATDKLLRLDKDLKINTSISTCQSPCTHNVNKILLINDNDDEIITCGTGNDGRCEIRTLTDLNVTFFKPKLMSISANRPALAYIVKGETSTKLALADTFGQGVDYIDQGVWQQFAWRRPSDLLSLEHIPYEYNSNEFLIYKKSAARHEGYNYIATNQFAFKDETDQFVSKLIRICDNYLFSYTDLIIQCRYNGVDYSLIEDIVFLEDGNSTLFVASFRQGSNPLSPTGESILCYTRQETLTEAFKTAVIEFLQCDSSNTTYDFPQSKRYFTTKRRDRCYTNVEGLYKDLTLNCQGDSQYSYMSGVTPLFLESSVAVEAEYGSMTSLHSTQTDEDAVLLVGTDQGYLLKYTVEDSSLVRYDVVHADPGQPIRAIHQPINASFNNQYYVLSNHKVLKYANTNCTDYSRCRSTVEGKNPVCGWCVYNDRATWKDACSNSGKANHWISTKDNCTMIDLDPKGAPVGLDVEVIVTVSQQPEKLYNEKYYCQIEGGTSVIAVFDGNGVYKCQITAPTEPRMTSLSFIVGYSPERNITLDTKFFLFYRCQQFITCGKCLGTIGAMCGWDMRTTTCNNNTGSSETIITLSGCPKLTNNSENLLLPNNTDKTLSLNISNVGVFDPNTEFWYLIDDNKKEQCQLEGSNLQCPMKLVSKQRKSKHDIKILYQTTEHLIMLDDDYGNKVTVYDCSELGKKCYHCKALHSKYRCKWKMPTNCTYDTTAADDDKCDNPYLSRITPRTGALAGSVTVTIEGDNLGYGGVTPKDVTVGGVACIESVPVRQNLTDVDFAEDVYDMVTCQTETSVSGKTNLLVNLVVDSLPSKSNETVSFEWKAPSISSIDPNYGALIGGTVISLYGENLRVGNQNITEAKLIHDQDEVNCLETKVKYRGDEGYVECVIEIKEGDRGYNETNSVEFKLDGARVTNDLTFSFKPNPSIASVNPKKGFISGGTMLTVVGTNLKSAKRGYIVVRNSEERGECNMRSPTEILCKVPQAPTNIANILKTLKTSNTTPSRKKRQSPCTGGDCLETKVYVKLDGVEYEFSLTYFKDPVINKFGGNNVMLYPSDTHKLTITGDNLNLVVDKFGINVTVGLRECSVINVTKTELTCSPPPTKPETGRSDQHLPEVNVTIGNIHVTVGYLEYTEDTTTFIIVGVIGGVILLLLIVVFVGGVIKYRKVGKKVKEREKRLEDLELEIKQIAREGN